MNESASNKRPVKLSFSGTNLLSIPLLNKGCAFTQDERESFNLTGLLPHRFETIEQQAARAYQQFASFKEPINKHIYLRATQDKNETLFYRLLQDHLEEMMPIIYTPVVGEACERFSEIYRHARGLFISFPDRHQIDQILANVTKRNVKVIVVTDGSRILGLGDQGVGGMGIPIGKLSLYTLCGGISPAYTLPIMLDVGTNNEKLLNDPHYLGWKHPRIDQTQYDEFLELFIQAIKRRWPEVLLQFEDFNQTNALPLLNRYRNQLCCFNDDIQGTAAVTVGTLLAACYAKAERLSEQVIVFAGAGAAGCGIAEQIVSQMQSEGLTEQAARDRIFMIDRHGLLTQGMELPDFQSAFSKSPQCYETWQIQGHYPNLNETVKQVSPTVLIGVSGQADLFTQSLIETMWQKCDRPIILPLSNPSRQIEAKPEDILNWTDGKAIIATGSPFEPVEYQGQHYPIPQCNNSYIFPALGLAAIVGKLNAITDEMLMTASEKLAQSSPMVLTGEGSLLPPLTQIGELSKQIAKAIIEVGQSQGIATALSSEMIEYEIEKNFWLPQYREYSYIEPI
jgi:malate dehydrogenase (oxaloacetate-decarboxylating)